MDRNFRPEVVVFIAKGSFIIGDTISKYFNVPLIEVYAVREGNKLKELISPLLKIIPKNLKNHLRKRELQSGIHNNNSNRKVYFAKEQEILDKVSNILIVDDSIDTGHTAKQVYDFLLSNFGDKTVKFACLNYFEMSKKVFSGDFTLYKNHIIIGPWSKDSKYYHDFKKRYFEWIKG
ncbi:phosphoribosyltransferase [Bacillus sp. JJ1122]